MKSCIKTKNPAGCGAVARTRTLAKLLEGDRRRLVEVLAVVEDAADDRAQESARTGMRRRSAAEEDFMPRPGTAVLPQQARLRIDVTSDHTIRLARLTAKVRD